MMNTKTISTVILLLAYTTAHTAGFCTSQRSPEFQMSLDSYRNVTGQWVAQVKLDHGTDHKDAGPWSLDVSHSTANCEGKESVHIVATVKGPRNRAGLDYEMLPGLGYYKFHTETKNWFEARKICAEEGAHLFIPNSPEELKSMSIFWVRHPKMHQDGAKNNWAYIGIHDLNREGEWETIFNAPLNTTGYTKWHGPEPNGGTNEDCGFTIRNIGELADISCVTDLPFICEQEF